MNLNKIVPDKRIDVTGLTCPMRGVKSAREMSQMRTGQIIEVRSDDPGIKKIIPILAEKTGNTLLGVRDINGKYLSYLKIA